jgi:hypothetical protein
VSRPYVLRASAPFAAALVTVALVAIVATAHHTDRLDPNDTGGKLDVRQVRLAHQPLPPVWSVVTFAEWRTAEMWDRGYVMVLLDTSGGKGAEYYLLVRSVGAVLRGSLWRARIYGPDSHLGSVPVRRLSPRSASVQVALSRLKFGAKRSSYRWWVQTLFTGLTCKRTCQDRAPNGGSILQWRPGMSPSPSSPPPSTPSPTEDPPTP